jgi:hypothetical protein
MISEHKINDFIFFDLLPDSIFDFILLYLQEKDKKDLIYLNKSFKN